MVQRPENEAETAGAILDAAEALFAGQGFAATTIKQIGAAAGVNPALIYYYFGSKEELYRRLLQRLLSTIATRGSERLAASPTPQDAVRALIGTQAEVLGQHPSIARLMAREMADHGAEHAQEGIAQLAATAFAGLLAFIEEGQRAGVFRADMDPRFAAISAVSLIPYFHLFKPAVGILLGTDGEPTPGQMDAYARHAAEFAIAALTKGGEG
ncbi:MAG TPA: TetR family transcriptional regulator [Longimicrobium sp.]